MPSLVYTTELKDLVFDADRNSSMSRVDVPVLAIFDILYIVIKRKPLLFFWAVFRKVGRNRFLGFYSFEKRDPSSKEEEYIL